MPQLRLQKILSTAGVSSRRASELLISEGRVTVNGETVTALGSKADPDADDIRVDGRRVRTATPRRYILMYKPRGYITTRSDPQQRPTVIDLLAKGGVRDYVYPVGRLDFESEGLLILTSDGDLAERLMHPSHGVAREYQARVRGVPDHHALERLAHGVMLDGRRTAPAEVTLERVVDTSHGSDAVLCIVLREGRNRQVRRMCEAVGHPVVRLKRASRLYVEDQFGAGFTGKSLFRARVVLPANVTVGPFVTHVYLFREEKFLSKVSVRHTLGREGLEWYLHAFAYRLPTLYGLTTVLIAVGAGLAASTAFRKGGAG